MVEPCWNREPPPSRRLAFRRRATRSAPEQPAARRSNAAWLAALRASGPETAAAVGELEAVLRAALRRILGGRDAVKDLDDLAQESLARIMDHLSDFRGDSAFTTWATGVATRVAFTELRRRAVREGKRPSLESVEGELVESQPRPEEAIEREDLLEDLRRAIDAALTERQRLAITAELRGVPTIEIAEKLGTNQNALYKLVHDARKKLRQALLDAGHTQAAIRELAGGENR